MKTNRLIFGATILLISLAAGLEAQQTGGATTDGPPVRTPLALPNDLTPISYDAARQVLRWRSAQFYGIHPPLPPGAIPRVAADVSLAYSPSLATVFLLDQDLDYSALQSQANAQLSLNQMDGPLTPQQDDEQTGGGYPPGTLYMQVLSVSTSNIFMAVFGLTNGTSAEIRYRESLDPASGGWLSEGSLVSTDDFCNVVMLTANNRTNTLFLTCRSPADPNETLPIAYQREFFNQTGAPPHGDFDADGVDNVTELLWGRDPNKISFLTSLPDYVNGDSASGTVEVLKGVAAEMVVLVNPTSASATNWVPYTPTFTAPLLAADGRCQVWVGLRGFAGDESQQTWDISIVTRDTTPPVLVLTNPVSTITERPMIDLQGYACERLASISYDISSDAGGSLTNQPGYVIRQYYDAALADFTTNWFECPSLLLALGTNNVTLRATDLAGNITVTNLVYVFDTNGDITPPALTLYFPQAGDQLAPADGFTARAWVDDPTAQVIAQLIDSRGTTNTVQAIVERNGLVWAEGLRLCEGTNTLILIATDAAGNVSSTNITAGTSPVQLTIAEPSDDELVAPYLTVSGTISDPGYTVWVNGFLATLDEVGGWWAEGVPLPEGGTAVIQARAIPDGESGSGDRSGGSIGYDNLGNPASSNAITAELQVDKPAFIRAESYNQSWCEHLSSDSLIPRDMCKDQWSSLNWGFGVGANGTDQCGITPWQAYPGGAPAPNFYTALYNWPGDTNWPPRLPGSMVASNDFDGVTYVGNADLPAIPFEKCAVIDSQITGAGTDAWTDSYNRYAQTTLTLQTGGKSRPLQQNLFTLTSSAMEILDKRWRPDLGQTPDSRPIPPEQVTLGSLGQSGADGLLYVALQGNATLDVTPRTARPFCTFSADAQRNELVITANGKPLSTRTPEFCVGQLVSLQAYWNKPLPPRTGTAVKWVASPNFANHVDPGNGDAGPLYDIDDALLATNPTALWWYSGGRKTVSCGIILYSTNGQVVQLTGQGNLTIYRPNISDFKDNPPTWCPDPNVTGYLELGDDNAGDMAFTVYVFSRYAGRVGYTQRIKRSAENARQQDVTGGYWLDNYRFYIERSNDPEAVGPIHANRENYFKFDDGPGFPVSWNPFFYTTKIADDFDVYVMFRPNEGMASANIYVCLGKLTWSWSATTTYLLSSGWSIPNVISMTRPQWPDESSDFPTWLHTYHNH